jgi:purine-binding chemotaxis protein CheW
MIEQQTEKLLTFTLADQVFGVPILQVNDVLGPQKITRAPLSSIAISGVMNLRGRIVTAIDVRRCLRQPERRPGEHSMSVVVEQKGELFSLVIDTVGEVLALSNDSFEESPETLDPVWRGVSAGVHKLQDRILVVLDVGRLLQAAHDSRA